MTQLVRRRRGALFHRRRTQVLGGFAAATTLAVAASEITRVWRKAGAPQVDEIEHPVLAVEHALEQTVEVAVAGYRGGSARENALLNMLAAFTLTFAAARTSTAYIRSRGRFGPFRNLLVGTTHVHHFVPGIVLAFLAGGTSLVTRSERLAPFLAVPFGAGMALTLDEAALLLELDDVYWSDEGVVSVDVTLATLTGLSSLMLGLRLLRRGEESVFGS